MTAKELAQLLDGRQYDDGLTKEEIAQAEADGLVVVMGYSDDNIEFAGAICDEVGAWGPTTVCLTKTGIFRKPDDLCDEVPDCPYCKAAMEACKKIFCSGYGDGGWSFNTDIPCERFKIYEEYEVFCEGLVFSVNDL